LTGPDRSAEKPQREAEAQAGMRPSGVEAHVVVDAEVVALAGGAHVVVAVEAQLDRPPAGPGQQRGDAGELGRLRLLAAEAAAHAAAFAAHLVHAPAEGVGHRLLHLGGVLGGAEQVQAVVLAGIAQAIWPSR
jgi:hypothetical protein